MFVENDTLFGEKDRICRTCVLKNEKRVDQDIKQAQEIKS